MSAAVIENPKLVILGTHWALTQFKGSKSCQITSYKTGHHFPGGKEAQKKLRELGELGTGWTLTQLGACGPSDVTTYKTGHHFQPGKEAQRNVG